MARNENPPFERGNYDSASALDTLRGKTWEFEDVVLNASAIGAKPVRTGRAVTVMLVKNGSGFALLPKRLVTYSTSAGEVGIVKGYIATTAGRCYPVDEYLPAAGVPDGSYFYIVVKGPAIVLAPLAGSEFNGDVSIGTNLVGLTAATTGATTAGRAAVQNITGSTQAADYTFLVNQIMNVVGKALTARTTGNTNSDILVDVQALW